MISRGVPASSSSSQTDDAQSGAPIAGEVGEARGVEQVDLRAFVGEGRERHVDGDAALVLFRIGVEDAGPVIDLAKPGRRADEVEQCLDERGLAGAPVAGDRHVPDAVGCD